MADALLRFETDHAGVEAGALRLTGARGSQRLGAPYVYELTLECDIPGGIAPDVVTELFTEPCRFEMAGPGGVPSPVHGVLRRFEMLPMRTADRTVYRATLVPRVARLELSVGSRIFQALSWPGIVESVLEEHAIPFEARSLETYPVREYTVQYEESDLAFVDRLLQHHGLTYFFEQTVDDGELMVIVDNAASLGPLDDHEVIPYAVDVDAASTLAEGQITALGRVHELRPAAVDLKDYNWRHPAVTPEGEHPVDAATGYGTVHVYGDHFKDPTEGAQLAQVRAEELMAGREVYQGRTSIPLLAPGHRFQLNGYPSGDLDRDYTVTAVEHDMDAEGGFDGRFTAIPFEVPYRPPRVTPRPRLDGFMHAVVDGEVPGMAAPIDELGRYKLLLPFDRLAEPGGRASRWVRMAQSSTGADYGMHLPLHIGCEVALIHVGGDPDRPLILGAVPNADTISPVTQADATKSRIRTKAGILIELEDDGP